MAQYWRDFCTEIALDRNGLGSSPWARPPQSPARTGAVMHDRVRERSLAGLWPHRQDPMHRYTELEPWIGLVKLLKRGRFDALFLADVVGVYDVFRGNRDAAVRAAAQVPAARSVTK